VASSAPRASRAGLYFVTILKSAYQDWVQLNVTVSPGVCGVDTTMLRADLIAY